MTSEAQLRRPPADTQDDGEPGAQARWRALIEEHGALLRRTIVRICPKNLGIQFDDIEQDARLRLWRAIRDETILTRPASYIYRTAVTATLDAVRGAKARREETLPETLASRSEPVTDIVARRTQMEQVQHALGKLRENRRQAVLLHLRGLTLPEVARLTGWSEFKARNLIYRGLKQLRKLLREEGIELEAD